MAKTQNAPATETATETKDTPKKILTAVVMKLAETNVDLNPLFGDELSSRLASFFDTIKTAGVRGLPAEERLANVETLIREHYSKMPDLDSPEHGAWAYESMKLLQRKERIVREIKDGGAHVVKGTRGKK